jgi:hypothetical protein
MFVVIARVVGADGKVVVSRLAYYAAGEFSDWTAVGHWR